MSGAGGPAPDRTRKAALSAAFGYATFGLALVTGLVVFPVTVRGVGPRDYGLWLATGELVGYLGLADLGAFAVLPWLVAAADGRNDLPLLRRQLASGLAFGCAVGAGLGLTAAAVWLVPGAVPFVPAADREVVRGPLALLLALTALSYPLKVFPAVAAGLQDVSFIGPANLLQALLTAALTVATVGLGLGLWGLAVAAGGPVLLGHLAAAVRVRALGHPLSRGWPAPGWRGVVALCTEGAGVWVAGFGYRLLTASAGVILVAAGRPEWATAYAVTVKAGQMAQQACWLLPDSALVGIAQLHGAGDRAGVRRVVLCTLHLHLLTSGAAALALLAFNRAFVSALLGPELYAGDVVNALLAAGLVLGSLASGLFKATSVAGARPLVGAATLVWGAAHCAGAVPLVAAWGLTGLSAGALGAAVVAGLVPGLWMLRRVHGIAPGEVVCGVVGRWLLRLAPFAAAVGWAGATFGAGPYHALAGVAVPLLALYPLAARGLLADVPWPARVRTWLTRFRLIPRAPPA